ncbi:hypothetical protein B0H17DRAFT_1131279 [Mycena rosella]|uniref:Nuclear pore complex protein n=1 Tax=Mycena rosella TaxID=1033263 RepID=A0AAD7DNE7_MYCRO|nr:hypothetical protein B0H17DRAFT_1131279 [Mycena rosella]
MTWRACCTPTPASHHASAKFAMTSLGYSFTGGLRRKWGRKVNSRGAQPSPPRTRYVGPTAGRDAGPPVPTACDLLTENLYTPTSTLTQAIMHASPLLSELIIVREWLQDTAPPPPHPEATMGYWKFTKHGAAGGLVKEMDLDSVNCTDGQMLTADNTNYEKRLAQALYSPPAVAGCEHTGLPAVPVTRNRAQSTRPQWAAVNENEDDAMEENLTDAWEGNRCRQLWKAMCTCSAINKQSMEMLCIGGSFWESGLPAVEGGVCVFSADAEELEKEEWEWEVMGVLEMVKSVAIQEWCMYLFMQFFL